MAIDSPIGVEVFFVVFVVFVAFSPNLGDWVCIFGVCVCVLFSGIFWSIGVCVECVVFCLSNTNN